ncbi:glycoside hydrolase family 31 protein [Athelia psychrophila]|uniref:Glycoside hydrolase family 31 protein n=1 Tax=Athelia psychrophila TaxID=1759441 RepID=A0A166LUP9_9AGAM|nr:glycoside hydrolase family 31 protein [Fibularhizoctonia sp. CBS 109695]
MCAVNISLETQRTDIYIYDTLRDFTRKNKLHFIAIFDATIPPSISASDVYMPITSRTELGTFLKHPSGDHYLGYVWAGACKFPDFLAPNTQDW